MKKTIIYSMLFGCLASSAIHAKQPIVVTPSFTFTLRCFFDRVSIPAIGAALSLGVGFWCLKNSINAWAKSDRTTVRNGNQFERIPRETMLNEAKKYGKASIACFVASTAIYFRHAIAHSIKSLPRLLLRR